MYIHLALGSGPGFFFCLIIIRLEELALYIRYLQNNERENGVPANASLPHVLYKKKEVIGVKMATGIRRPY